jgi:hypothetical protein
MSDLFTSLYPRPSAAPGRARHSRHRGIRPALATPDSQQRGFNSPSML